MKYAFVRRSKPVWAICGLCRALPVSVSRNYEHRASGVDIAQRRHLSDEALLVHISIAYADKGGVYGWPRIWRQPRREAMRVGKLRVQQLMQKQRYAS
jgi:hypothetical protein